jgi:hypothetical protein
VVLVEQVVTMPVLEVVQVSVDLVLSSLTLQQLLALYTSTLVVQETLVVQQLPVVVELLLVLTLGLHTTVVGVVTLDVQVLQVQVPAVVLQL